MKNLSFARVNIKTYNVCMCIVLPFIAIAVLADHIPALLSNFSLKWLLSLEFLQGIALLMCYAVPVSYVLCKVYEIAISDDDRSRTNSFLGFISCCVLVLPLVLIGLAMFAKLSFFIPIAFTVGITFIYFRSFHPAAL